MRIIVAADENWGIGKDGGLLTHLPEDMRFFRTMTVGKVVVMGRKTLQSLPGAKPLKNRTNIVLTSDKEFGQEGLTVCHGTEEVFKALKEYQTDDVYVIGGQSIYEQFLPFCDTAFVTFMERKFQADTHFVNLEQHPDWELLAVSEKKEHEGLSYEFRTYHNKNTKH